MNITSLLIILFPMIFGVYDLVVFDAARTDVVHVLPGHAYITCFHFSLGVPLFVTHQIIFSQALFTFVLDQAIVCFAGMTNAVPKPSSGVAHFASTSLLHIFFIQT
jgi:hypothetical protein